MSQKARLSERAKGMSHELWVGWQLQRRGIDVIPVGGFVSFDLLALSCSGSVLHRIEVKAAREVRGRYYAVAGRAGERFGRYAGRVEFFVFVAPNQARAWVLPVQALPLKKTSIALTDYWLGRWDLIAGRASGVKTATVTTTT